MTEQTAYGELARGAVVQARVIGALIIRELHARFGRENIGYLWFILEPLMLASGISFIQVFSHVVLPGNLDPLSFHLSGYICYMIFRSNMGRAINTVLSNRVLMYHRQVMIVDLIVSRAILEFLAAFSALIILMGVGIALGLSHLPARPLLVIVGMVMMGWFSAASAMIVCALVEFFPVAERFVHPFTYLMLPASGMFFRVAWLPEPLRGVIRWTPMPQIIDIVRLGIFGQLDSEYIYPFYLIGWCGVLTLIGLLGIKIARRRVQFE